jgi:hypothetical protein
MINMSDKFDIIVGASEELYIKIDGINNKSIHRLFFT